MRTLLVMPAQETNIANYYDEISSGYDELYGFEQKRKLSVIMPFLREPILDVGCGTGVASPEGSYGIDPSLEMIKKHPGFSEGRVFQGSAENLPFEDKQFYTVISLTALHHCKDLEKALKEIKRVGVQAVLSILKTANNLEEIKTKIHEIFNVHKEIEEDKDIIFVC